MKTTEFFSHFNYNKYLEKLPSLKEKKTQAFTTLTFTLVALSFFGFFSISPTVSTIVQLRKQLQDSQFINDQLKTKINNLRTLQQKYAIINPDISLVTQAIPQNPSVTLLAAQIQAIAEKSQVGLSRIQVNTIELSRTTNPNQPTTDNPDKYASFTFTVDGTGSFSNIASFFSSLINFDRIVTVDVLSISQNGTNVQFSLRAEAYFKK